MKRNWIENVKLLPVWIVVADLLFGVALNIRSALLPYKMVVDGDGLPVSPAIAFDWIQVVVNGGMVFIVLTAIFALLKMKRLSDGGERLTPNLPRALEVLTVLAFAMPAVWLWLWAAYEFFVHGRWTVDVTQPRYVMVAVCQPYLVWMAMMLWRRQHGLYHGKRVVKNMNIYQD